MDEQQKKQLLYGASAAGLVVLMLATWLSCRSGKGSDATGLPEDTHWACQNPTCKHTFSVKRADLIAYQKAHPKTSAPPCPTCGKNTAVPAIKCPNCGTVYPSGGRGRPVCPKCNQPAVGPA
jgi:hypothetical protein